MSRHVLVLCFGLTAMAGPISVTGAGAFEMSGSDPMDNYYNVFFSGSDGLNSASGGGTCRFLPGFGCSPTDGIGAYIDGVHFHPGFFSFALGDGSGVIIGFDSPNHSNPVMSESLVAYIQITSMQCGSDAGLILRGDCKGAFVIMSPQTKIEDPSPIAEPGSINLILAGVTAVITALKRRGFLK